MNSTGLCCLGFLMIQCLPTLAHLSAYSRPLLHTWAFIVVDARPQTHFLILWHGLGQEVIFGEPTDCRVLRCKRWRHASVASESAKMPSSPWTWGRFRRLRARHPRRASRVQSCSPSGRVQSRQKMLFSQCLGTLSPVQSARVLLFFKRGPAL